MASIAYQESVKISDILGADLVSLPTRRVKIRGGEGALFPGYVMVGGVDDVFHLITVADAETQPQVAILGEAVFAGATGTDPANLVYAAMFFGGSFREGKLTVTEETPSVDLFAIREYLLLHNIYLESSGVGQ